VPRFPQALGRMTGLSSAPCDTTRVASALTKFETLSFCVRGTVSGIKSNVATLRKLFPSSHFLATMIRP
jgi:hypothetical protein